MIIPSGRGYSPRMGHGMGTVREIPTTGGASNQRFSDRHQHDTFRHVNRVEIARLKTCVIITPRWQRHRERKRAVAGDARSDARAPPRPARHEEEKLSWRPTSWR